MVQVSQGCQESLLLLLSHFSRVRLCATPSLGFSRQEHWSGLPFPSPMHKSESEVAQSCLTLCDPLDCSLPGSSIHGIFQESLQLHKLLQKEMNRCQENFFFLKLLLYILFFFFSFFISWRLITSQHFSEFCHTLT